MGRQSAKCLIGSPETDPVGQSRLLRVMMTQANAEKVRGIEGLNTISALTHRQIVECSTLIIAVSARYARSLIVSKKCLLSVCNCWKRRLPASP